jgi:hypothetical protein
MQSIYWFSKMNQSKCILSQELNIWMPLYLLNYSREVVCYRSNCTVWVAEWIDLLYFRMKESQC